MQVQIVLWEFSVQIFLELLKTDCVSFLVLAICFLVLDLQAIVCQMSVFVVHIVKVVALTAGAQVANVVEVEVKVALGKAPDSDVEFPSFIQERPLKIFLDDPV